MNIYWRMVCEIMPLVRRGGQERGFGPAMHSHCIQDYFQTQNNTNKITLSIRGFSRRPLISVLFQGNLLSEHHIGGDDAKNSIQCIFADQDIYGHYIPVPARAAKQELPLVHQRVFTCRSNRTVLGDLGRRSNLSEMEAVNKTP